MIGLVLIACAVATSLLAALALASESVVATLLLAYLAYVANLGLVTLALSPFRAVTQAGLGSAEAVLLVAAAGAWWWRGRPTPAFGRARAALAEIRSSPVALAFCALVVALLAYELALGLTVPPNNMDSLTYHLTKVAAWAEHGGMYWIPNVQEIELNQYQPLAEQQNLYLTVATGTTRFFALPQFLAELACLASVYGMARRLGSPVRAAACAAALFATFSIVALEAMTAQNDLVAASLPAVSAFLLLGGGLIEPALAGVALGLAVGVKLTVFLVAPLLVWLAVLRGRRILTVAAGGFLVGFVAVGMWSYVLNLAHTGHPFGVGTAFVQDRAAPGYPRSLANALDLLYGLMDLSVLSNALIVGLALVGLASAFALAAWNLPRRRLRAAVAEGGRVALPFCAPLLVLGGAGVVAFLAAHAGVPIRGPNGILAGLDNDLNAVYTRFADEDYSAYGPLGIVALATACGAVFVAAFRRRGDPRELALACALPVFLVLVALTAVWVPFLIRYFLLPGVLTAPLLARLFVSRSSSAAYLVVACLCVGLTLTHDQSKQLGSEFGRPWTWSQQTALTANSDAYLASTLAAYQTLVPPHACIGAVIGPNEPAFLLYGTRLEHRVTYLNPDTAVRDAESRHLQYVVISQWADSWLQGAFQEVGVDWHVQSLGGPWALATPPAGAVGSGCQG